MKRLFTILAMLVAMNASAQWVQALDSQKNSLIADSSIYYPMKIGNEFYYKYVQDYSIISYFTTKFYDTVTYYNKKYFKVNNFLGYYKSGLTYIRYDTLSGYLKIFDSTNTPCNRETKLFKLNGISGDTIGACSYIPGSDIGFYFQGCSGNGNVFLFDDSVVYKRFDYNYTFGNYHDVKNSRLARNFGIFYSNSTSWNAIGSITREYYLIGAKINGILYGDTISTIINNISTETPSMYSLSQNYPNPFNPKTKIKFSVVNGFPIGAPGNDKVVLKVYDVMGREVQTLVNERLQPGTYEATFDGSMLNSGLYFYRLMTDGFSETKKMLLIK